MKNLMQRFILTGCFLVSLVPVSATAQSAPTPPPGAVPPSWGQPHRRVPEIDAAGVIPAITILGGLIALISEKKRGK